MNNGKTRKIILLAVLPAAFLTMTAAALNFTFRPLSADRIESIGISTLGDDGHYTETIVTDSEKIKELRGLILECENDINIFDSALFEAEKYQRDPQIYLRVNYKGDSSQDFTFHKNSFAVFDRANTGESSRLCVQSTVGRQYVSDAMIDYCRTLG